MKPTDKAIVRMVSESPDRNASEPRSGLDKINPKAEPSLVGRRQHGMAQTDRSDRSLRRGGRDSTVARTCRATGETVLVPSRNRWSKVDRITGKTGKASEGETVAARPVVAEKRGNARGAKGPCGTGSLDPEGRQRGDDQGTYPSAGPETKTIHPGEGRLRLEAVEPGMALRYTGTLFGVPRIVSAIGLGSRSGVIGPISLNAKCAGARSAGNPHATCEVAGAGNRLTVRLVRHSQRKRGAMDRPHLRSTGASPRPYRRPDRRPIDLG